MEKNQTHVPSQASPQTLPMGLNFLFFCFFWFSRGFGQIAKNHGKTKKNKKNKKVQTHVPSQASPQTLPKKFRPCPQTLI